MKFPANLSKKIQQRKDENFYRSLTSDFSKSLIDFSSNDYLGLAKTSANHTNKTGSTGSRLLSGNYPEIEKLESYIANYHQTESCLVFNSGYTANLGLLSSVPQRNDVILFDQEIHASIRDGIRLSNAKSYVFKHNDINDLAEKLYKYQTSTIYVVVESVYSISGDSPNLQEFVTICNQTNAYLIVDEAHSFGLAGINGSGLINQLSLEEDIFARVITFGKALGYHGAAILCSNELRNYLINFCRPFIYTTAPPPTTIETIYNQYQLLKNSFEKKEFLFQLKTSFTASLNDNIKFKTGQYSAIVSITIEDNTLTKRVASILQDKGFDIKPILSPTVAKGNECIRICFHSFNTMEETRLLANQINEIL